MCGSGMGSGGHARDRIQVDLSAQRTADAHIGQGVVNGREIGFGQRDIGCLGVLLDAAGTATDGTHAMS